MAGRFRVSPAPRPGGPRPLPRRPRAGRPLPLLGMLALGLCVLLAAAVGPARADKAGTGQPDTDAGGTTPPAAPPEGQGGEEEGQGGGPPPDPDSSGATCDDPCGSLDWGAGIAYDGGVGTLKIANTGEQPVYWTIVVQPFVNPKPYENLEGLAAGATDTVEVRLDVQEDTAGDQAGNIEIKAACSVATPPDREAFAVCKPKLHIKESDFAVEEVGEEGDDNTPYPYPAPDAGKGSDDAGKGQDDTGKGPEPHEPPAQDSSETEDSSPETEDSSPETEEPSPETEDSSPETEEAPPAQVPEPGDPPAELRTTDDASKAPPRGEQLLETPGAESPEDDPLVVTQEPAAGGLLGSSSPLLDQATGAIKGHGAAAGAAVAVLVAFGAGYHFLKAKRQAGPAVQYVQLGERGGGAGSRRATDVEAAGWDDSWENDSDAWEESTPTATPARGGGASPLGGRAGGGWDKEDGGWGKDDW